MLVRYARTGGRGSPPDDEELEIEDDGEFSLHRSVAERCVGGFAGAISSEQLAALRAALEGVPAGEVKRQPSVPGVLEIVETANASATFGYEDGAPDEWAEAVDLLETLLEELTDESNAAAAVALDVAADGTAVSLRPVGDGIDVDTAAARATADFFSEYQEHMRTAETSFAGARQAGFDPPISFEPEETVMVRVEFRLARHGSPPEDVVVTATLGRGWDDDEEDED